MAYRVFWQVPQQVLCVELEGAVSLDDFIQINQAVHDHLGDEKTNRSVALLVDITRPGNTPQAFQQLKASQTYVLRRDLRFILVVGSNKFMRLMMMLIFNLCKPSLRFFDNMAPALTFLDNRH
jgi:hypothetical protein